jgi:hypothetical protein
LNIKGIELPSQTILTKEPSFFKYLQRTTHLIYLDLTSCSLQNHFADIGNAILNNAHSSLRTLLIPKNKIKFAENDISILSDLIQMLKGFSYWLRL